MPLLMLLTKDLHRSDPTWHKIHSLKEGEIISISYDNTDYGSSSDDARLIFTGR